MYFGNERVHSDGRADDAPSSSVTFSFFHLLLYEVNVFFILFCLSFFGAFPIYNIDHIFGRLWDEFIVNYILLFLFPLCIGLS